MNEILKEIEQELTSLENHIRSQGSLRYFAVREHFHRMRNAIQVLELELSLKEREKNGHE